MELYKNDPNFGKKDERNRWWRLSTIKNMERLDVILDKLLIVTRSDDYTNLADLIIENKSIEFDILYDDIRNGLILPENDIIEFINYFIENKELHNKKLIYLSWILNTYFKSNFLTIMMNDFIEKEEYENAAFVKFLLNVKNMPSVKE